MRLLRAATAVWLACLVAGFVGAASVSAAPTPISFSSAGASEHHYDSASSSTTPTTNTRVGASRGEPSSTRASRSSTLSIARVLATKGVPRAGASALEDASQASFKAADGPINISRKHLPGAGGRYNKFAQGVDADSAVREALRSPNAMFRPNPAGGYRVDTDLGRAIGQGGRRTVRTIVSPDGRVITAFPYGPKRP